MLMKDGQVLTEKRKRTKPVVPGAVALPGGHVETRESPEETLYREVHEEVGIIPIEIAYVCTLLHRSQEFRKLHYFAVTHWEGEIISQEAESVVWIPLNALESLDLDVDKIALQEYLRIYTSRAVKHGKRTASCLNGQQRRSLEAQLVITPPDVLLSHGRDIDMSNEFTHAYCDLCEEIQEVMREELRGKDKSAKSSPIVIKLFSSC